MIFPYFQFTKLFSLQYLFNVGNVPVNTRREKNVKTDCSHKIEFMINWICFMKIIKKKNQAYLEEKNPYSGYSCRRDEKIFVVENIIYLTILFDIQSPDNCNWIRAGHFEALWVEIIQIWIFNLAKLDNGKDSRNKWTTLARIAFLAPGKNPQHWWRPQQSLLLWTEKIGQG